MGCYNRIKIICECKNPNEAEIKVNEFLATSPDIAVLVDIKYYLEDGIAIIEYVTNRPAEPIPMKSSVWDYWFKYFSFYPHLANNH